MEVKGSSESLFTRRHLKLLNIARVCEIFAWIYFVISMLSAGSQLFSFLEVSKVSNSGDFFTQTVSIATTFAKGLALFMALLGISVGLRMIIETDVNFRLRKEQNSNEH